MAPRKLSESDKQEILSAYRQSDETTSTLAGQYSVSVSTISRILKQSLPEREYEILVQQKRSGVKVQPEQELLPGIEAELPDSLPDPQLDEIPSDLEEVLEQSILPKVEALTVEAFIEDPAPVQTDSKPKPPQLRQKRSHLKEDPEEQSIASPVVELDDPVPSVPKPQIVSLPRSKNTLKTPEILKSSAALTHQLEGLGGLDEDSLEDELDDDDLDGLDDDDLDSDLEDELDDETDPNDEGSFAEMQVRGDRKIQVMPLSEANIPRTCYVVVDRASELITRPLKDFAELGQIPAEEIQEKTLPIFDNHRIAKRFLRRMQRVVKVPDGQIFKKVSPYLQAKGITRLLIDGQIYSI
ncbi:MAG: hypothetical protein KME15_02765 [Drouetiella hepatica Uher 2000/2452]|jgi:transposase-like protein|uniref:Transposase n=1 Tax=Drouetiella hepatica Uher 2000/2452 TaxID=904376 RepID=A0A951Q779_9CYAN|nr:hypothetical protein [Drouetiella hepatica Uher 2000/2452]